RSHRGDSLHAFAVGRRVRQGAANEQSGVGLSIPVAEVRSKDGVQFPPAAGVSTALQPRGDSARSRGLAGAALTCSASLRVDPGGAGPRPTADDIYFARGPRRAPPGSTRRLACIMENPMTNNVPVRRHALGLPAGSIRAAHVLVIVGITCALIVNPQNLEIPIPAYLIYLTFLILGHYFASHGNTIAPRDSDQHSPLYLPGGTVRFLIILALGGAIGW